jgi:hypothetical protein
MENTWLNIHKNGIMKKIYFKRNNKNKLETQIIIKLKSIKDKLKRSDIEIKEDGKYDIKFKNYPDIIFEDDTFDEIKNDEIKNDNCIDLYIDEINESYNKDDVKIKDAYENISEGEVRDGTKDEVKYNSKENESINSTKFSDE